MIFGSVLLAYSNAFLNPFLYGDDERLIIRNQYLRDWHAFPKLLTQSVQAGSGLPTNFYRPVQLLNYALISHTIGILPWAFHGIGILYHAANAVLLYLLLRRLLGESLSEFQTALLALLWALHPIQIENVADANGTATPMHLFGILSACLFFLSGHDWWALAATAFGLGSKESAVVIPPLLLVLDWASGAEPKLRRHAPQWILVGAYALSRMTILNFGSTLNFYPHPNAFTEHFSYRLFTLLTILAGSLKLLAWPSGLHPEHSWPMFTSLSQPPVMLSAMVLCVLLGLAIGWRKKIPFAAAGILWYFISYAPMSNLFAEINALFWEHWLYAPSVGLILLIAALWSRFRAAWLKPVLAVVVILAGIQTFRRNFIFRSQEAYSRYVLQFEPTSAKHWTNLAIALADRHEHQEAIADYRRAIALDDEYPQTHYNLANAYLSVGRPDLAEREYLTALSIDPSFYFADLSLGNLYLQAGRKDRAVAAFESAYKAFPDIPGLQKKIESLRK